MPVIKSSEWPLTNKAESRFLRTGPVRLPVFTRRFLAPHDGYVLVVPQGKLSTDLWKLWVTTSQRCAAFDVERKAWIWSWLALERESQPNGASAPTIFSLTNKEREELRQARKLAEVEFQNQLQELQKNENIPEHLWPTYQYPTHYQPTSSGSIPTALQRIVVNRYWNRPYALIAASVGTGKSRMVVDILSARATATSASMKDSARITLIVAPLALHENWKREFNKWSPKGAARLDWRVHKFAASTGFWSDAEDSATFLFDGAKLVDGGLVIICTPNALSRPKLAAQFAEMGYVPTAIVVDEVQRFFRKIDNKAYKNLLALRQKAHLFLGLSGTPTSKFEDWWALEELMSNGAATAHWQGATITDYQKLGDRATFASSGLHQRGWSFERGVKEYHADRIRKGNIFVADKWFYMKDALPGLDQEELGEFADARANFHQLFADYPAWVDAAAELQAANAKGGKFSSDYAMATTLLLRMRQLAAMSANNEALLKEWVDEFLDPGEPAVLWVEFVNDPAKQLDATIDLLNTYGPTCYIAGGMTLELRQEAIDGFMAGKYRFIVCQIEAGGVGLTLTRACKCLFLTIPLGYQSVCQAIGRLHRIGQDKDVTSYFAMTSPVAAFARYLYDKRCELNETIPKQISGLLPNITVDATTEPALT